MGRLFWLLIAALAAVLVALVVFHDRGNVAGIDSGSFAQGSLLTLWGVFLLSAVVGRNIRLGQTLRHMAGWAAIVLVLMTGYVFRYDLQDFGARLTGGLLPGSPIARVAADGSAAVTLIRSPSGHFEAVAGVNDASVRFLVDTGASSIVLSHGDAARAGIDPTKLRYDVRTQTANGEGRAARTRLGRVYLGGIERRDVPALIAAPGRLSQSLLGQTFLESLSAYERRGDRLTLRD